MEWQPIETAPVGENILVVRDGCISVARTDAANLYVGLIELSSGFYQEWGEVYIDTPTHWMPLPESPAVGNADAP
jgi:hypothetical protein